MQQRVLVTAGAYGIGSAIAAAFSRDGAKVHIVDFQEPAATPDGLTFTQADLIADNAVELTVHDAMARMDGIDVLVNNLGIAGGQQPIEQLQVGTFMQTIRANVGTAVGFISKILPQMRERESGVILNISSVSVATVPEGRSDYNASKAAIESLTKSVAREAGPYGVRCNAIRPGMVDNFRMRSVVEEVARKAGSTSEDIIREQLEFISMRTAVDEADVANLCLFLASDHASRITGQVVSVCGGLTWEP